MAGQRSYVAGHYFLTVGQEHSGALQKVEGGGISCEVLNEKFGVGIPGKHLGPPRYEDFSVTVGTDMGSRFWDWVKSSWTPQPKRESGSVVACNYELKAQTERTFTDALISQVTFPAIDASSKSAGLFTVSFSPELTRTKQGDGKVAQQFPKSTQKMFIPSNFRLEIPGLDCTRVTKIDSFSVKMKFSQQTVGVDRKYEEEPAQVEFPNLKITFPAVAAKGWTDWFQKFAIEGDNGEGQEKPGTLTLLSPNRQTELMTIHFKQMGIFRLAEEAAEAGTEKIHNLVAELYCEGIELVPGHGGAK